MINTKQTIKFEVDNYLNIYHPETGLYLMFHKTTFPDICFYLAQEYTQLVGKQYYQIYLSKRLDNIEFSLNQGYYHSKDQRTEFLQNG